MKLIFIYEIHLNLDFIYIIFQVNKNEIMNEDKMEIVITVISVLVLE